MNKLRAAPKALSSASKDLSGFPFLASLAEREEMVRNGKLTVRPTPRRQARSCLWSCASLGAPLQSKLGCSRARASTPGAWQTIIFIRDKNHKGQEVSGYIDYAHRLKTENFEPYFERRAGPLRPSPPWPTHLLPPPRPPRPAHPAPAGSDDACGACSSRRRKQKLMPKPSDLSFYNWETQTSTSNQTQNFQVIADNEAGLLFKNKRDRKVINVDPKSRPGDNSRRIELQTHEYIQVVLYDHVTRRKT